ncbi:MAG: hypothetical protein MR970_07080 [Spirochaetia bacterium]|nr:hypothetical protein [Spirochaetia bacterium]MDY4211421.1 hypothetical protein [Treponema sp.]
MKKIISILSFVLLANSIFAASYSYKDNTYQRLADEYTKKAEAALDAGEYDLSVEYAQKAEENAALSKAFIESMLARQNADEQMKLASKKLNWAKDIKADKNFPMAYSASEQAYNNAKEAFDSEDYASAENYARQSITALEGVREVTPLPQYYVVRPWAETKDCYWNISGRKYVYNNPLLWENLYQKNKSKMPKPNDPNLILPGMKMEIPSLTGEYREGTYNPDKEYDAYSANR